MSGIIGSQFNNRGSGLIKSQLITASISGDAVTGAQIADDTLNSEHYIAASIDNEHLADDAVGVAELSATGTASSATFLRGDNSWAAPGGGAWSLISSTDISNAATFNFTAVDASSYDAYCAFLQHLIPATDNVDFHMTTSTNGGSSYDTGSSDYRWTQNATEDEVTTTQRHFDYDAASIQLTAAGTSIHCNVGSDSEEDGVSGFIYIIAPHVAKLTTINWSINYITATPGTPKQIGRVDGVAARNSQADVDAWSLYFASGNIESGTASVFGIKNS